MNENININEQKNQTLVIVKSDYDFEELITSLTIAPPRPVKALLALQILTLVGGAMFLTTAILNHDGLMLTLAVAFLFCALLLFVTKLLTLPKIRLKLFYNSVKKQNAILQDGCSYEYVFNDTGFFVTTSNKTSSASAKIDYQNITFCGFSKTDVYFFFNNFNCYICKKSSFKEGELEQVLRHIPSKNIGKNKK